MKNTALFFLKGAFFAVGLVICLYGLALLVDFTNSKDEEALLCFAISLIVGVPVLLFAIKLFSGNNCSNVMHK